MKIYNTVHNIIKRDFSTNGFFLDFNTYAWEFSKFNTTMETLYAHWYGFLIGTERIFIPPPSSHSDSK